MTLKDAIEVLSKYSRWRKGTYLRAPSPQEFAEAVDVALDKLITNKKIKREQNK
jgi:hypothetical protein